MDFVCRQCHAQIAAQPPEAGPPIRCPACGGEAIADSRPNLSPPNAPPAQVDRRGIVLPRRLAVGGVITPR